jgi:hypothetical protein
MSHRLLLAPVLLSTVLAGCGMSEEDFSTQSIEITCQKFVECFDAEAIALLGFTNEEECIDLYTTAAEEAETDDSCEFDGSKGQDCLDAWEAVTCEDMNAGTYDVSACDDLCKE